MRFILTTRVILGSITVLALFTRFWFFPQDIYFGFDQARDAYAVQELLQGDLKIVGPTTSFLGLHHGILHYYLSAPFYWLGQSDPAWVAAFLRVANALGVIIIFAIASLAFSPQVGYIAALLFAFSFEQTQFAMYINNPSLATVSMLVMFWGLALLFFAKKPIGLPIVALGLGLSIQFELALAYLAILVLLLIFLFSKSMPRISARIFLVAIVVILLTLSSYLVAEVKFGFGSWQALTSFAQTSGNKSFDGVFNTAIYTIAKMTRYNIVGDNFLSLPLGIFLIMAGGLLFWRNLYRQQLIFLVVWFFSVVIMYLLGGSTADPQNNVPLYYTNIGISPALLIFSALILYKIFKLVPVLGIGLLGLILINNLQLIAYNNPKGTISELTVQRGMLLSDQKQVVDFIYSDAGRQPFAIKAITMPFFVGTTWSYLFDWYGRSRFGYVPIWNGKQALGFPNKLPHQERQEGLPAKRYLIVEPLRGVPYYLVEDYFKEEDYFTKVISQKQIGQFLIQERKKF
ncbi:hypothetical protein HY388_00485 [Candidatus Daviesbacteria bacterium]|nr:hypothetical protein [Candidatus Daviesbacteria bacterium]